jgi:hypothetical protein
MNLQCMDVTPRRRWPGSSGCCVAPQSSSGRQSTSAVQGRLDSRKENDHAALDCPG